MSLIFQRYGDDEFSDSSIQMHQRILATIIHHHQIDTLACQLEGYKADPSAAHDQYPWAARFVMGTSSWQLVWNVGVEVSVHFCCVDRSGLGELSHERMVRFGKWAGLWQKTVRSCWMASNVSIAFRSIFLIDWLSQIHKGSQGFGLKLAMASASGSYRRSLPMPPYALTTR